VHIIITCIYRATFSGTIEWLLYTGLTVYIYLYIWKTCKIYSNVTKWFFFMMVGLFIKKVGNYKRASRFRKCVELKLSPMLKTSCRHIGDLKKCCCTINVHYLLSISISTFIRLLSQNSRWCVIWYGFWRLFVKWNNIIYLH
jgi:hypothetical protein